MRAEALTDVESYDARTRCAPIPAGMPASLAAETRTKGVRAASDTFGRRPLSTSTLALITAAGVRGERESRARVCFDTQTTEEARAYGTTKGRAYVSTLCRNGLLRARGVFACLPVYIRAAGVTAGATNGRARETRLHGAMEAMQERECGFVLESHWHALHPEKGRRARHVSSVPNLSHPPASTQHARRFLLTTNASLLPLLSFAGEGARTSSSRQAMCRS